jgi:hypothetical protein
VSPCKPQPGNVLEVGPEVFDIENLTQQKIQETCLWRLCDKHGVQYNQLFGNLEQKAVQDQ